jgi:hypothetical protein
MSPVLQRKKGKKRTAAGEVRGEEEKKPELRVPRRILRAQRQPPAAAAPEPLALSQPSGFVDDQGLSRHIDSGLEVGEYMRMAQRAAERMPLPEAGPPDEKGYMDVPLTSPRDALAAGARYARSSAPNEFPRQRLVDEDGELIGKVYQSPFGNRRPPDARNPGAPRPFSNLTSGPSGAYHSHYGMSGQDNIYGSAHYASAEPDVVARQRAVSISEMNRGMGAGAGQLLAQATGLPQEVSRDVAYGPGNDPGLIPASYQGSERDIIDTETAALHGEDEKVMEREVGHQIAFQLDHARHQRRPRMERRGSAPDLPATASQVDEETQHALLESGFSRQDVRLATLRTPFDHPSRAIPNRPAQNRSEMRARSGSFSELPDFLRDDPADLVAGPAPDAKSDDGPDPVDSSAADMGLTVDADGRRPDKRKKRK